MTVDLITYMILIITIRCTTRRYGASSWISGHFDSDLKNPQGAAWGDTTRCGSGAAADGVGLARGCAAKLKRRTSSAPKAVAVSGYPWAGRTPAHGCSVGGHKASVGGGII